MQSTSALTLVYLNAQGQGVVTCPQCTAPSEVSGAIDRDLPTPITSMCAGGHRVPIRFNPCHDDRKAVGLSGTYTPLGESTGRQMTVVNLSVTGVHLRTLLPHMLHVEDVVELAFRLDDGRHTEIPTQALIRWVDDTQLGAACCEPHTYARELGVYLRPV